MLTLKDARDWIISERAVEINGDQERSFLTHDCILYFFVFCTFHFVFCALYYLHIFVFFVLRFGNQWRPRALISHTWLYFIVVFFCTKGFLYLYFVFCTIHFVFCTKSAHFSHVVLRPAPHFEPTAVLEIASFDDKLKTRNRLLQIFWMKNWWLRIICQSIARRFFVVADFTCHPIKAR